MQHSSGFQLLLPALLLAGLAACSAEAGRDSHAAHVGHGSEIETGTEQRSLVVFSDEELIDQHGNVRRLKSDIVGSNIVVVDFIFTSCQTICPVTTSLMAEGRRRLADVPPGTVTFISMSVDSNVDTPARLKAFADRFGADWSFLTGEKHVMDEALVWLNAYATNPEDHAAMIVIGDAATDEFTRIYGLPDPELIEARVRHFMAVRSGAGRLHQH